jgi:hypothetical protein
VGGEQIQLRAGSTTVSTFTMTTGFQNFTASTTATGNLQVHFINDNGSRDVQLDNIIVNGTTIQAESRVTNTAVWQNNACGGSNSEWLNCNGFIDFGAGTGARFSTPAEETATIASPVETDAFQVIASPNPVTDKLTIRLGSEMKGGQLLLINTSGKTMISDRVKESVHTMDVSQIPSGLYLLNVAAKSKRTSLKILKK